VIDIDNPYGTLANGHEPISELTPLDVN